MSDAPSADELITVIRKNAREDFLVAIREFKGHQFVGVRPVRCCRTSDDGDNRLPLVPEIKVAHGGFKAAAKTAADRVIESGVAPLEAKAHLGPGAWRPSGAEGVDG